jgi:hypothetical protein
MAPATDWKEVIPDGEADRFERLAEQLRDLQRRRARGGTASRGLHAKAQAGVEGELTVLPDLPEHARVGLFATPATWRAYVRFSNGAGVRQPDWQADVRGVAIKLLGVPGKKIIPGLEDKTTQDFLLIQNQAQPFRDVDEFVWFALAAARPALLLPKVLFRYGPIAGVRFLRHLLAAISTPIASVATRTYYSALPIKFGPYAVRYALAPRATDEPGAKRGKSPTYLTEELAARLLRGPVEYDFQVQFYEDEARTPIEDGARAWDAPFVTVARLTLPKQDLASEHGREVAALIEGLSFDPWHAGVDFRPLGSLMRARNHAYRLSTMERKAAAEP